ncbi:hypothetical protein R1flu_006335 [Riccia fluitans]|uniref:Retrotransposon gag domain-containing protein n=1 Tax=Riccia fluitans TaxID=41844 RepID=A0ABD1YVQ5_9MARC
MPFFAVPAPFLTLGRVMPSPLSTPRQDLAQIVNAARSVGKFKRDGATKPDHHLKNFEAVMQAASILDHTLWITMFKTTLIDEATNFADDLDEERVTSWLELKDKFIMRYRGDINLVMRMDNLAKVQHKKGEPVLAYINWFKAEAKWLPLEEANFPMVASHFLRNLQPNVNDPCCFRYQPGRCTLIQLYQCAQEIQQAYDWKGSSTDQASSARQTNSPGKREELTVEVERVRQKIISQVKEANLLLTLQEFTVLSLVCKEFMVRQLAGELVPPQQLISDSSVSRLRQDEPGSSSTPAQQSLGDPPADMRAIQAFYVPPMILVQIGDVT